MGLEGRSSEEDDVHEENDVHEEDDVHEENDVHEEKEEGVSIDTYPCRWPSTLC